MNFSNTVQRSIKKLFQNLNFGYFNSVDIPNMNQICENLILYLTTQCFIYCHIPGYTLNDVLCMYKKYLYKTYINAVILKLYIIISNYI